MSNSEEENDTFDKNQANFDDPFLKEFLSGPGKLILDINELD